ncbi:uncharacterized protein LOC124155684 [Ischnura elegans]|uniref:uncharacterized protein LOC124155684 n=1 Tax=Ischnura elegans TaxID=197161 RepID=UPI001ED875D2|nr:uncharacterized protein LOC124155684 [Ischnura elegans]
MSSSIDSPSAVMLSQITEFTETERRFRRIRYALIAFFLGLTLSLIVYLLLSWETSEAEDDDDIIRKNISEFQIIMIVCICVVVIGSIASFLILEFIRRRTIRDLVQHHNEVLSRYYEEGGSISEPRTGYTSRCSMSTRSSWAGRPPPSAASSSSSAPPPAYEELVQRGEFVYPSATTV